MEDILEQRQNTIDQIINELDLIDKLLDKKRVEDMGQISSLLTKHMTNFKDTDFFSDKEHAIVMKKITSIEKKLLAFKKEINGVL